MYKLHYQAERSFFQAKLLKKSPQNIQMPRIKLFTDYYTGVNLWVLNRSKLSAQIIINSITEFLLLNRD